MMNYTRQLSPSKKQHFPHFTMRRALSVTYTAVISGGIAMQLCHRSKYQGNFCNPLMTEAKQGILRTSSKNICKILLTSRMQSNKFII